MASHSESPAVVDLQLTTKPKEASLFRRVAAAAVIGGLVVAGGFTLDRGDARQAKEVRISTAAPAPNRAVTPTPEDIVPGVQAAEAETTMKIINYVAAVDFAQKQKAVGDYIAAVQAAEAAEAAQAAAQAAAQQAQQSQTVYYNSDPGDFLACVRQRESGGNYGIYNAGGSGAAGAYQFLPGTWNSIAASSGREDLVGMSPAQASPADQDAMAEALYAQQGTAPWAGGNYAC